MISGWTRYRTEELIKERVLSIGDGYRAKNSELSSTGLPFARAGNINLGFNFHEADLLSFTSVSRAGDKIARPGDVVFTSKGTVGRFAFVQPSVPAFAYSPQLCYWRVIDTRVIEPRYLYYWMHGREFWTQFNGVKGQTDMADYVSLTDQRHMWITLPPLAHQQAIASILGALDDKIELNRRMNETLEAMARALFARSVHGAAVGESEDQRTLGELVELSRATVDPSQYPDELFDHFSIPAYDDGRVAVREPGSKIKSTKFLVSRESVLISKLNPHIPRVWLPASREDARAIASTEFLVVSARRPFTREFLYTLLSSPHFTEDFASRVTGTSGSHQRVKPADLLAMRVRVPGEGDIEELSGVLRTLLDRAQLAIDESRNLAATRDALLPRLLSGEQRVRDMERGVEMAV